MVYQIIWQMCVLRSTYHVVIQQNGSIQLREITCWLIKTVMFTFFSLTSHVFLWIITKRIRM